MLIVLESNGMAQSTSTEQTFSGDIEKRVEGFGLEYIETSTDDLLDLDNKVNKAINQVRNNNKPTLININTNRLNSHSKGDDNRDDFVIKKLHDDDFLNKIHKDDSFKDLIRTTRLDIINIIEELENIKVTTSIKKKEKIIMRILGWKIHDEAYKALLKELNINIEVPSRIKTLRELILGNLSKVLGKSIQGIFFYNDRDNDLSKYKVHFEYYQSRSFY